MRLATFPGQIQNLRNRRNLRMGRFGRGFAALRFSLTPLSTWPRLNIHLRHPLHLRIESAFRHALSRQEIEA
jgi:hypothetical protein